MTAGGPIVTDKVEMIARGMQRFEGSGHVVADHTTSNIGQGDLDGVGSQGFSERFPRGHLCRHGADVHGLKHTLHVNRLGQPVVFPAHRERAFEQRLIHAGDIKQPVRSKKCNHGKRGGDGGFRGRGGQSSIDTIHIARINQHFTIESIEGPQTKIAEPHYV